MISQTERSRLQNAKYLVDSAIQSVSETGEPTFITTAFRMSAFMPMNIPLLAGMILSPPTMGYTILW